MLKAIPIELKAANEFVSRLHRHHVPVYRDKFRVAAVREDGKICGVIQIGRPVSRNLDDGMTVEVVRLCTDGTKNACSFLYARAASAAKALGYQRIITYILETESGASLKSVGWIFDGMTNGGSWDRASRPRDQKAPICKKKRYVKYLS